MATSAKAIIASFKEYYKTQAQAGKTCHACNRVLQESVTGNRPTSDGPVCSDCYYELLGQVVERHPITTARAHRG